MAMTREQMDEFDRIMMGIMVRPQAVTPLPQAVTLLPQDVTPLPSRPLNDPEGRPLTREYSLDDIRRFFGMGDRPAMSPAEAADAAQMFERVPNPRLPPTPPGGHDAPSPSIPSMPSIDPSGAAAPIPPPPRPAAPPRPRLPVMRGLPTNESGFVPARPDTLGGVSPADMAAMGQVAPPINPPAADPIGVPRPMIAPGTMVPGTLPGEASNIAPRLNAEQLARALRRYGRMQMDPESFAARYARTMR